MEVKWMVYDKIINGKKFSTNLTQFNESMVKLLSIQNIRVFTRKKDAEEYWKKATNGIIYKSHIINNSRKVPKHLRKAGNIHKYMEWTWKYKAI